MGARATPDAGRPESNAVSAREHHGGAGPLLGSMWERLAAYRVTAALIAIFAGSAALRIVLAGKVPGPGVFPDELGYERMAQSLAQTGHLAVFGKAGLVYSPLYSIFLAPIYALTSSAQVAYDWAQVENAVLLSLSAFPVYGIARFVLPRRQSIVVAGLSLLAPLMFYSGFEMSENLAYPLFLVAVWAMLRAVRNPGARNDALLVGTILLASAARLQLVALFPAAVSAVLLVALVPPSSDERRLRAVLSAGKSHWLLLGIVGGGAAAALLRTSLNGGKLPLAGIYANVGQARATPGAVLEAAGYHLAELDFAMGVIPLAGALLAAYVLVRSGFKRKGLLFGSVAFAVTVWILLEVAFDAVAFPSGDGAPRIHERYLIYLVPLFLVALVSALQATRARIPAPAHVVFAATAALLPAVIPFSRFVNIGIVSDSFGLQVFGKNAAGNRIVPISQPVLLAVVAGAFLALSYVYAVVRPRPSFAIVMTAYALVILSSIQGLRMIAAASAVATGDPLARVAWVDRAIGPSARAVLVQGRGAREYGLLGTAFENLSISRVYYTCQRVLDSGFGEQRLTLDSRGRLQTNGALVRTRYAIVPPSLGVRGHIVARRGGLLLVRPNGDVMTVPAKNRSAMRCGG